MKTAIVTMTRDQGSRLEEWVNFHANLGIQKFVIYLDFCSDNSQLILEEINKRNDISIDIHETKNLGELDETEKDLWIARQHRVYDRAINDYKNFDWLCFIEVDEFIVSQNSLYPLMRILVECWIRKQQCIYINSWDMKPPFNESKRIWGQSTEIWTDEWRYASDHYQRGKSIINPKTHLKCGNAHWFHSADSDKQHVFKFNSDSKDGQAYTRQLHPYKPQKLSVQYMYINDDFLRIYHCRNHQPANLRYTHLTSNPPFPTTDEINSIAQWRKLENNE
jgi:hypothetical protein